MQSPPCSLALCMPYPPCLQNQQGFSRDPLICSSLSLIDVGLHRSQALAFFSSTAYIWVGLGVQLGLWLWGSSGSYGKLTGLVPSVHRAVSLTYGLRRSQPQALAGSASYSFGWDIVCCRGYCYGDYKGLVLFVIALAGGSAHSPFSDCSWLEQVSIPSFGRQHIILL